MLILIIMFSGMNSSDSNNKSKEIVKNSIIIVDKVFNLDMNDTDVNRLTIKLNYPFRKICHFSEYFLLGLFVLLSLRLSNVSVNKCIIITIVFCLFFSISDEIHQMYIEGRSPLILDCFIDTMGSSLLCFIYYLRSRKLS